MRFLSPINGDLRQSPRLAVFLRLLRLQALLGLMTVTGFWTVGARAENRKETTLYREAKLALQEKNYAIAEEDFRLFLQTFPASPQAAEVYLLWGQTLYFQNHFAEAVAKLTEGQQKFSNQFPDSFLFWLAEAEVQAHQEQLALSRYHALLESFPHSKYRPQAYFALGDALLRLNRFAEAKQAFQNYLDNSGSGEMSAEAWIGLGKVAFAQKDLKTAQESFEVVVQKHPKNRAVWLARYWHAECRAQQDDAEGALVDLAEITTAKIKILPETLLAQAWYATGRVHLQNHQFVTAAEDFSEAEKKTPASDFLLACRLQRAEALFRADQIDKALQELREFAAQHATLPLTPRVWLRIAEWESAQKRFAEALAANRTLLSEFPGSPFVGEAHFAAGWALWELGRPNESLEEFIMATQTATSEELKAQAQFKIGDLYCFQNQFARAIENYQAVATRFSSSSVGARARFQVGVTQMQAGQPAEAAATFQSWPESFAGSPYAERAQFQAGAALYALQQFAPSRTAYGQLMTRFPKSPLREEAWLAIAQAWRAEGHYAEALAQYEQFPHQFPDHELQPRALFERAETLEKMGDLPRAHEAFTRVVAEFPQHLLATHAQFWLAQQFYTQKEFLRAQEAFERLAQTFPERDLAPEALFWAGRSAMNRQAYDEARNKFEALITKYPKNPRGAEARFFQGEAYTEESKFDAAILLYDQVVRNYPASPMVEAALGRKGDCHFTLGKIDATRYDKAIEAYRQILTREKAPLALLNEAGYGIGRCLQRQGKAQDAFQEFAKVLLRTVASSPHQETFWFAKAGEEAALIQEAQKKWTDAVRIWDQLAAERIPSVSEEATTRAEKIRKEHPEEF